jgi:hypothetical protein
VAWQRAFVVSVIVQWLVEALLFETIECLYVNCLLPSMASRDVQRVYETLNEAILHLAESLFVHAHNRAGEERQNVLNAPEYLFVSTTVSKAFPKLMESMLISAYRTYLPGHVASKWKSHGFRFENDRRGECSVNISRILIWLVYVLSWIVQMVFAAIFAYTPLSIQKFILRVLQPFIATGVLYAWWYALTDYRSILVIGICLGLLFIYLLYQHRKFQKRRQNRLLSILPLVNALDEKEQEQRDQLNETHAEERIEGNHSMSEGGQRPQELTPIEMKSFYEEEQKSDQEAAKRPFENEKEAEGSVDDDDASSASLLEPVRVSVSVSSKSQISSTAQSQCQSQFRCGKSSSVGESQDCDNSSSESESCDDLESDYVCSSSSGSSDSSSN